MKHRRLRKGPRIVLALLAAGSLIGMTWRFVLPLFERPTFTLFIHSPDAARDPSRVIAVVHASKAEAWAGIAASPKSAESCLWLEKLGSGEAQRLFGSYAVDESELTFTPAAPLAAGGMYHFVFLPPGLSEGDSRSAFRAGFGTVTGKAKLELIHQVPAPTDATVPKLQTVHPSAEALPANHLKFYLTFSEPMEQGVFMERIRLLRADGGEIAGPFRETELWSPDGKRLTVWLHPGRQKTGVNLNEDEGAVLREGETVTVVISGEWRAASGQKLGVDFQRIYRVTKAEHDQLDPARWTVRPPKAGTREALRIELSKPLDWALLQNSLLIVTASGSEVAGQTEIANGEREWRFTPKADWSPGEHRVRVSAVLEDLAGNNLERTFEVDVAAVRPQAVAAAELRFRVE